jgi:hypothetical protein
MFAAVMLSGAMACQCACQASVDASLRYTGPNATRVQSEVESWPQVVRESIHCEIATEEVIEARSWKEQSGYLVVVRKASESWIYRFGSEGHLIGRVNVPQGLKDGPLL